MVCRVFVAAALILGTFPPGVCSQPSDPKELPAKEPADPLDGPPYTTAKAWAVADGKTGKLLWGKNDGEKRPIASTTKIMTALLVLQLAADEPKILDEIVTFSEAAAKTPGSGAKLLAGERLPVRDLLFGLMLPSGNDAAVALAEHFGPRFAPTGDPSGEDPADRFIAEMNRRAKALDMPGTSYLDPNGLSSGNLSTVRDLAVLTFQAQKLPAFREYVRTRRHTCEVTDAGGKSRTVVWDNTNRLLGIDGYDGVKTGTTTPAGACLVTSGQRGDDRLIVVVLGATSSDARYTDTRNLFHWAWAKRGHADAAVGASAKPAGEKPLAGAVIVVDPGHGGQGYSRCYTGGTRGVASGLTESELNLRVATELARLLRAEGATVHMTRTANHRLSPEGSSKAAELHARVDFFDAFSPHFFLSVHHNAGPEGRTGHTALYKHNAADDTLFEALARDVNDALEGAVPGPKLKLIKGDYHILRETEVPGTISEGGFMTNRSFDEAVNRPDFPAVEAAAIAKGAVKYWAEHKPALVALRARLTAEREARPCDPKTHTAVALNPDTRAKTAELLAKVAPGGGYDPAKVADYVAVFKTEVAGGPGGGFDVRGEFDGKRVRLSGAVADRKHHDRLIDLLVAMKVYDIVNDIRLP